MISEHAFISPDAIIGAETVIEAGAWVGPGVQVGSRCRIEQGCRIGYGNHSPQKVMIGDDVLLATGAVIYFGASIEKGAKIRHSVVVRENVVIGEGSSIGSMATIEPHTRIGRFCSLHTKVHITDYSEVGDYVFIGPGFLSMSDPHLDFRRPRLHQDYRGVTIGHRARIGGGVIAMPSSRIGIETVVGAGSLIQGNLPDFAVCVGRPARSVRRIVPNEELELM